MTLRTHLPIVNDAAPPAEPAEAFGELLAEGRAAPLGDLHVLGAGPSATAAARALASVVTALARYRPGDAAILLSLEGLSPEARGQVADALGEGEVRISVAGRHPCSIRETVLPGLWRVRQVDAQGGVLDEFLEVADVPSVVRAAERAATRERLEIGPAPDGAMNALPVLAELAHRMGAWQPGEPNHVVSFTLLPMNDVDMRWLRASLGRGPVLAESGGYGPCRVELSAHRHVWSVQYRSSLGALVLDTLEVGDVPSAIRAAAEDFEDSAARLSELLGES